jgi:hypothetical protein
MNNFDASLRLQPKTSPSRNLEVCLLDLSGAAFLDSSPVLQFAIVFPPSDSDHPCDIPQQSNRASSLTTQIFSKRHVCPWRRVGAVSAEYSMVIRQAKWQYTLHGYPVSQALHRRTCAAILCSKTWAQRMNRLYLALLTIQSADLRASEKPETTRSK